MPKICNLKNAVEVDFGKRITCLMAIALVSVIQPVGANGWEHTSIPLTALITALKDDSADIRTRAAHSLGHRYEDQAVEGLIDLIKKEEPIATVRAAAFQSLGKIGDQRALPLINLCLAQEKQVSVRAVCAAALGGIPGGNSEQTAIKALADSERSVRANAITSVGKFKSIKSLGALSEFIRGDDEDLRLRAIDAMGNIGMQEAVPDLAPLIEPDTEIHLLIRLLRAAARIGASEFHEKIKRVYISNSDPQVQRYALIALSATKHNTAHLFALRSLQSEDLLARLVGLEILRENASIAHVTEIAATAVEQCRTLYATNRNWSQTQSEQTVLELSLLNEYLRTLTALDPHSGFDLYKMASASLVIPVLSAESLKISEGFYRAKWQAIYGLGYTIDPSTETILGNALRDADHRIRSVALRSAGVYGSLELLTLVAELLNDPIAEVRWTAAAVLGRLGSLKTLEPLTQALDDLHGRVRQEAALALGYLGNNKAVPALENLLVTERSEPVRQAATFALSLLE